MTPWIPLTLFAAFCQNLRSALQKRLTARLSANEASYVRFCYAVPFAALYVLALHVVGGYALPRLHATFLGITALGSVAQILGTVSLIRSFGHRNFAVGTAYSKTETVQTAIVAFVLVGDAMAPLGIAGILVSLLGVLLLSTPGGLRTLLRSGLGPGAWLGMGAGTGYALAAVSYREAALSLPQGEYWVRAAVTLLTATTIQTLAMGLYLALRESGSLGRVVSSWRASVWVGLAGMLASVGWFSAMTLERAAYVRALGQVELLFAFVAAVYFLGERVQLRDVGGAALVTTGLVLVLFSV